MRSFFLLPLLAVALIFSSCKKEEITQIIQPNVTLFKTLEVANWKFDAGSNTYYNDVAVPEIDDKVAQTSGVFAYITFDNKVYEALPDVLDGVSFIYRYQQGLLTVESQGADGSTVSPPATAIGLKIVLVASEAK